MKLTIASVVALLAAAGTIEAVKVNPLPKPQEITWGNGTAIRIGTYFQIVPNRADPILVSAIQRTTGEIRKGWQPRTWEDNHPKYPAYPGPKGPAGPPDAPSPNVGEIAPPYVPHKPPTSTLGRISLDVADFSADLQHGVDESYTIDIKGSTGKITAKTRWGALRALTTLEQLIIQDPRDGLILEASVSIKDHPLFPHRSVTLDTGRNFYPVKDILRTIDALSLAKLNVFHWHIDDSQSWPIEIKAYPQMTKDAYSRREVYSQADVRHIVQYARERGVRVIPEIDMPGHSAAGYKQIDPKLVSCSEAWWDNDGWTHHTAVEPTPGQLDILYPKTYEVIKTIFSEISSLFPDAIFHAGFDELNNYCYNYSQPVSDWFNADLSRTYHDLSQYFLDKTYPIFKAKNKRVMYWEDVVVNPHSAALNVPKDAIMQSWNGGPERIKELTSKGYDTVVSSSDWFYLDCGFGGWVGNDDRYDQDSNNGAVIGGLVVQSWGAPAGGFNFLGTGGSWCAPYKSWQRIYGYDFTANLTETEKKHVLGASVALWSEQSDTTVLDSKIWPRAAALAESLWSGNRDKEGRKRYNEATVRILEFRERLVDRGVNAAPLMPKWCLSRPHQCDIGIAPYLKGYN